MKKNVILLMAFAIMLSFSSCKKKTVEQKVTDAVEQVKESTEKAVDAVEEKISEAGDKVSDIVGSISTPKFKNDEVNKFTQEFKDLMGEYADLKGEDAADKKAELEGKFNNWAEKATTLVNKIEADEMVKFNKFIDEAQAKFNELTGK